jgi:hypothetical protein
MLGVLLTKWTIRLALACYVTYLAGWLLAKSKPSAHRGRWPNTARAIWTLGCVLFVVHVACAFHFYHHWSHTAAWQTTAQETEQLLGVAFGDGIYFSYLFLILWALDVAWLWLRPRGNEVANGTPSETATVDATAVPQPPPRLVQTPPWRVLVHIFLLFIAFNGAIVFEPGPTRWGGIAACLTVGYLVVRRLCDSFATTNTKCLTSAQNRRIMRQDEAAART